MSENNDALDRAREIVVNIAFDARNLAFGDRDDREEMAGIIAAAIREERERAEAAEKRAADLEEQLIDITAKSVSNCQTAAALELALREITETARILRAVMRHEDQLARPELLARFHREFHASQAALSGDTSALAAHDAAVRRAALLEAAEEASRYYTDGIARWLRELAEKEQG